MERLSLREIIVFLMNHLSVEDYFFLVLIGLIVVGLPIVELTSEEKRFMKKSFLYCIIVIIIILIVIMKTSLIQRRREQKVVRYKCFIIFKKPQDNINKKYLELWRKLSILFIGKLLCESEKSYILKTDLMSSNVGCSPGQMRKQNFGDSLSRDRSNESKRLNTLPNAQFEYTYFRRQLNMLENEI